MGQFNDKHDQLKALIEEARFVLTDSDIQQLSPINNEVDLDSQIKQIKSLMGDNGRGGPFSNWDTLDMERPELKLLSVMKNPDFFPFTCKNLFCRKDGQPLNLLPFQHIVLLELWWRQFPMFVATRGAGKTFLLAVNVMLKLMFKPGHQIAVVSKTLRQSKAVYEYCEAIWINSPILRSLVNCSKYEKNGPRTAMTEGRYEFRIGDSIALFLPLGASGESIRGIRAQEVIADEIASINPDVYAVVVQGFGAVSGDPIYRVGLKARKRILDKLGLWTDEHEKMLLEEDVGNQSIVAGTASYRFNHFFKMWQNYHAIIQTRGDQEKLKELFPNGMRKGFDWRKYSIIRIPWSLIPEGFMDDGTIDRAEQISTRTNYLCEYEALFPSDSEGFFKRSNIERCTVGNRDFEPIIFPGQDEPVSFDVSLEGDEKGKYVYGIDPALTQDNFAVTIIERFADHRRVVYCWTTKRKDHQARERAGKASTDFYDFVAKKLRSLFTVFPPELVMMDSQGGGYTVEERMRNPRGLEPGELPLYREIDPKNPTQYDQMPGLHILRLCQFRKTEWLAEANWGLQKDLETRILLFPRCDELAFGEAYQQDLDAGRIREKNGKIFQSSDSLENILHEIEDLKNELVAIEHTQTQSGLDHWDVRASKEERAKGLATRKDRYSALLLANDGARRLASTYKKEAAKTVTSGTMERSGSGSLYNFGNPALAAKAGGFKGGRIAGNSRRD